MDILKSAQGQRSGQAETELHLYLRDYHLGSSDNKARYAYNSEDAMRQAKSIQTGLWKIMDHGICPNGGTLCSEGWCFEDEVDGKIRKRDLPVPEAGSVGCGLCKFFLTGPPWLAGLIAEVNEAFVIVDEKGDEKNRLKAIKQKLEQNYFEQGKGFMRHRDLHMAQERFESAQRNHDVYLAIQQAVTYLALQSVALGKQWLKDGGKGNLPIIYQCEQENLEAHFVECSKFDLYDDVCQNSEFFPSINPGIASLRRAKMLNQSLERSGKRAVLLHLDDQEQLIVGNAMAKFLMHRVGRDKTNDFISGRATLAQLKIRDQELERAMMESMENSLIPELTRDDTGSLKLALHDKLSLSRSIEHFGNKSKRIGSTITLTQ
jgi:hypothetical protein